MRLYSNLFFVCLCVEQDFTKDNHRHGGRARRLHRPVAVAQHSHDQRHTREAHVDALSRVEEWTQDWNVLSAHKAQCGCNQVHTRPEADQADTGRGSEKDERRGQSARAAKHSRMGGESGARKLQRRHVLCLSNGVVPQYHCHTTHSLIHVQTMSTPAQVAYNAARQALNVENDAKRKVAEEKMAKSKVAAQCLDKLGMAIQKSRRDRLSEFTSKLDRDLEEERQSYVSVHSDAIKDARLYIDTWIKDEIHSQRFDSIRFLLGIKVDEAIRCYWDDA